MKSDEANIEVANLQKEIEKRLSPGDTNIVFDYRREKNRVELDVITVNPRHKQSFLFHSTQGVDKVDALRKMLDYVKTYREQSNSYTIQWAAKNEDELQTSYFHARDIPEALDKLYYGRDPNSITIFSVVLNPIS